MEKRQLNVILAILFCAAIFAAPALFFLLPRKDFSELEKRYLAEAPALSAQSLADGSFSSALDGYVTDHFPGRGLFVGLNAYYDLLSGRQETKDYFLRGGRLFARPVETDPETLQTNLEAVNDFCRGLRESGAEIPVTLMLVPSSGAVLLEDENFPDDGLIAAVYDGTEAGTVDLTAAFRAADDPGALYYRTDHHWTSEGAFEALCAYRRALGRSVPCREDYRTEPCGEFYGSAYAGSGLWLTKPDSLELWVSGSEPLVSSETQSAHEGVFYRERLEQQDKYTVFLDGNHSLVRIENASPAGGGGRLLVIRDSFSNCLGCFLADLYDRVILVDLRYYKLPLTELLLEEGIDEILIEYSVDNFLHDRNLPFLSLEPETLRQRAEEEARRAEEERERLEQERRPPNYFAPPPAIGEEMFDNAYYLGDSVIGTLSTYCVSSGKLPDTFVSVNAMLSYYEAVEGIKGHLIYDGRLSTLTEVLRSTQPELVIGALGCNDLARFDTAKSEESVLKFLDIVRAEVPEATIFLQSVMPIRVIMADFHQAEVDEFNAWLRDNAEALGYCYIELDKYFKGEDGELSEDYLYNATHIKASGGELWYRELMNIDNYVNFPEKYYIEYDGATGLPVGETVTAVPEAWTATESPAPTEPPREETALDRIYARIAAEFPGPEMMPLSGRVLTNVLGLHGEDYRDGRFYLCANNLKADEIWLIEAEDEAAAQALLALAQERIEIKAQSYDRYLPEESEIIRRGAAVASGRWVGLFISPDAEAMRELFLAALETEN